MATTMTFRRALLIVTGWAMTTALMLDFMLACVHAVQIRQNHLSELGRHIVDGTNGRSDDAFLAAIVVVLTFVPRWFDGSAVIYVIQRLVSRLLDQAKENRWRRSRRSRKRWTLEGVPQHADSRIDRERRPAAQGVQCSAATGGVVVHRGCVRCGRCEMSGVSAGSPAWKRSGGSLVPALSEARQVRTRLAVGTTAATGDTCGW